MADEQAVGRAPLRFPYFFLLLNLFLVGGIYFMLTQSVERTLTAAITEATQAGNAAVTRIFINEVYPELRDDLALGADLRTLKRALSPEELARVDRRVREFMFGTDILKAKIYNLAGITLYASDPSQVGEDKRGTLGFESAARGVPASQVTHRGKFSALDGEVFDKDLVASYIPIRGAGGQVIGVAEIYTDRSPTIRFARELTTRVKSELIPLLAGILLVIALIIWRFTSHVTRLRLELGARGADETPGMD